MFTRCPHCGWPDAEPYQVVSSHQTHDGRTVWSRCRCGSLQTRVVAGASSRVVARTRPAA